MATTINDKRAAHAAVKSLATEAENLAKRRIELAEAHKAEAEAIQQRQNEICAIQAPLNSLLEKRVAIIERIQCATAQLAKQGVLQAEWTAIVDKAVGQHDAIHLFKLQTLWNVYGAQANAERVATEIQGFLTRRQAELGNLEAEIQSYAGQNALEYLLPADLAAQPS